VRARVQKRPGTDPVPWGQPDGARAHGRRRRTPGHMLLAALVPGDPRGRV
jgi:hypothetical protein